MDIRPGDISLLFAMAGEAEWGERQNGFVHRKTEPFIIIAQALEGSYDISCASGPLHCLKPGEAFLTAPNVPLAVTHHCDPRTMRMRAKWIHFNFNAFNSVGLSSLLQLPPAIEKPWADKLSHCATKMLRLQSGAASKSQGHSARIAATSFEALAILLDFLESKGVRPTLEPGMARLLPAIEYCRGNLPRRIDVGMLARKAGLSTPRFHAEFKRHFNEAPLAHLRSMRLAKACELLRSSGLALEEIALQTGFCNQFHFSREFKKAFGLPPSEYRIEMRLGAAP